MLTNYPVSMNVFRFTFILFRCCLCFLFFSGFLSAVQGQNYSSRALLLPPSPEAISLSHSGRSDVSLYTGRLSYSIPLFTIGSGDFQFPIDLRYVGGNGIKVSEVSSSVGLGWSLSHVGLISRTVRDKPDDHVFGYVNLPDFPNLYDPVNLDLYVNYYGNNTYDSQPDIFHLSAGELQASFYLTKQKEVLFIEQSDLKIVPIFSPTLQAFHVRDLSGNLYVFSVIESIKTTTYGIPNWDDSYVASSWYLQSVSNVQGSLLAEFQYTLPSVETLQIISRPFSYSESYTGPIDEGALSEFLLRIKRPILQKILFDQGSLIVKYPSYTRQDLSGDYQIDSLILEDNQGRGLKKYKFHYGYFNSTGSEADPGIPGPTYGNTLLRLKLNELEEIPSSGSSVSWGFEYESAAYLPARIHSFSQDHWGYYNGQVSNTGSEAKRRVKYYQHSGSIFSLDTVYAELGTANREPSLVHSRAGVLRKVILPTGGEHRFDYELHSTDDASLPGPVQAFYKAFDPTLTSPVYFTITMPNNPASKVTVASPVTSAYMIEYHIYDSLMTQSFHVDTLKLGDSTHEFLLGPGRYRIVSSLIGAHPDPFWYYGSILQWENEITSLNKPVGGLRISKIDEWDPVSGSSGGVVRSRRYYYNKSGTSSGTHSTGSLASIPSYGYQRVWVYSASSTPNYFSNTYLVPSGYQRQLHSQYPLEVEGGYHVGYSQVTEVDSDFIRSEYYFTTFHDFLETQFGYRTFYNDTYTDLIGGKRYEVLPVAPLDSRNYLRGRLIKKIDFQWNGSTFSPVFKTENTYAFNMGALLGQGLGTGYVTELPDTTEFIKGILFEQQDGVLLFKQYDLYTGRYDLKEQKRVAYHAGDSVVSLTQYVYGDSPWFRDSVFHYLPTRVSETSSQGALTHQDFYYPYHWRNPPSGEWDGTQITRLKLMEAHHRIGQVVLNREWIGSQLIKSVKELQNMYAGLISPLPGTIQVKNGSSSGYVDAHVFQSYTLREQVLQEKPLGAPVRSYLWSNPGGQMTASVENASQDQVAFANFESDGKGNWSYLGAVINDSTAPTGRRVYNASSAISKSGLNSALTYELSYWAKSPSAHLLSGGPATLIRTQGLWSLYRRQFTGISSVSLSGSVSIDDVRLYPLGSRMVTYTWDPLLGISSITDTSGGILYYEYDGFGRLKWVRDDQGHIVESYQYHVSPF